VIARKNGKDQQKPRGRSPLRPFSFTLSIKKGFAGWFGFELKEGKMAKRIFKASIFVILILTNNSSLSRNSPPFPNPKIPDGSGYVFDYLLKTPLPGAFKGTIQSPYDHIIGYTWYDYQHNSVIPRMIANDYQQDPCGENGIHSTFMSLIQPEMTANRFMYYACKAPCSTWTDPFPYTHASRRGGYGGLDIFLDNREVFIYHYVNSGPDPKSRRCVITIEKENPGEMNFMEFDVPDSCNQGDPYQWWDEGGMWPHGAVDSSGFIHILMKCGTGSGIAGLGYTRCSQGHGTEQLTCKSPGIDPVVIDKGKFIHPDSDLVAQVDLTEPTSYIVACDPNSRKVSLVWGKWTQTWPLPDDTSSNRYAQDVWYLESQDCGDEWISAGDFDNVIDRDPYDSPNNITKWRQGKDKYRASMDMFALYDLNHQLHIFFHAIFFDEPARESNIDDVKLFHWSENTERICGNDTIRVNFVQEADWECEPGGFNLTLSKISAGVGILPENENYLYCLWTQFNQNDLSAVGFTNGELYASVSTNSGLTWALPTNITNTPDPGCASDDCDSDHWSSLAARVDSFLHIQYVNDRDAGGIPMDEGSWTYSPILYHKHPVWNVSEGVRIDWFPKSFVMPDLIQVPNNGSTSKSITVYNNGTDTLNVTGITGPPWAQNTNPSIFSILEGGCPQIVEFDVNATSYSETLLVDSIRIQSSDQVGNDDIYVPIHLMVSDEHKSPQFAAVSNNSFTLMESNVGNIGHQQDSAMMTFEPSIMPDPIFAPVFDGSIIIGTDQGGKGRVGRYVYKEPYMLAGSELKQVDIPNLKAKVTKAKCSPAEPLPPYQWKWWWLGVEYYDQVFYSGDPASFERFVKFLHIKIYKKGKPSWWDDSDTTTTNPYCLAGIAADIDCPSDTGKALNTPGVDSSLNLLYQQGFGAGNEPDLFAGIAWIGEGAPINGIIVPNEVYIWPWEGWHTDSLWSLMSNYTGFDLIDTNVTPRVLDYHQIMTGKEIPADLAETDTVEMEFLIVTSIYGLDSLKANVKMFKCGNANRDNCVNLSDIIAMAKDYFGTGPETFRYLADVEGDCDLDLTDVINLANYYLGKPEFDTIYCNCQEEW